MIAAVWAACDPDPTPRSRSGARQVQVAEEDRRHGVVVVLAGVDEALVDAAGSQCADDRRGLHEVGPGADDVCYGSSHVPSVRGAGPGLPAEPTPADYGARLRPVAAIPRRVDLALLGAFEALPPPVRRIDRTADRSPPGATGPAPRAAPPGCRSSRSPPAGRRGPRSRPPPWFGGWAPPHAPPPGRAARWPASPFATDCSTRHGTSSRRSPRRASRISSWSARGRPWTKGATRPPAATPSRPWAADRPTPRATSR